jgi:hypothetical protein
MVFLIRNYVVCQPPPNSHSSGRLESMPFMVVWFLCIEGCSLGAGNWEQHTARIYALKTPGTEIGGTLFRRGAFQLRTKGTPLPAVNKVNAF